MCGTGRTSSYSLNRAEVKNTGVLQICNPVIVVCICFTFTAIILAQR